LGVLFFELLVFIYRSAVRRVQPLGLRHLTLALSFTAAHGIDFFFFFLNVVAFLKEQSKEWLEH
jgi:hypothetical protein